VTISRIGYRFRDIHA